MGLRLADFMSGMNDSLRRKPFRPSEGFVADPVPALNAQQSCERVPAFRPAVGFNRDPVPAGSPTDCTYKSFVPNEGFVRDPIPARSGF